MIIGFKVVKYGEQKLTQAEFEVIRTMYQKGIKVSAIKFARDQFGLQLQEAKGLCDTIGDTYVQATL